MDYDYDVIVVGGGPAGLSAAIRTRWIKRYKALACSTLLIENSRLGGQAGWHGSIFTGPSWQIEAGEIICKFKQDIHDLNIPTLRARVTRIEVKGQVKEVHTADGRVYRSLAVIIATGIKMLVNELDFLGKGLEVTSMGYEAIVAKLKNLLSRPWHPRLVIVGSPKLKNLIPLIRRLNRSDSPFLFVIEGSTAEGGVDRDMVRGWIEQYRGKDRLEGICLRTEDGLKEIPCGGVLLEFNSYELEPTSGHGLWEGFFDSPFVPVDADMRTSVPGIFAAGDATLGGYNAFSRAVSQGMMAGLSTYQYVYQKKLGEPPSLFAYRPTDFFLTEDYRELPVFDEKLRPVLLCDKERLRAELGTDRKWLHGELDGKKSMATIANDRGMDVESLRHLLQDLVEKKLMTFHADLVDKGEDLP